MSHFELDGLRLLWLLIAIYLNKYLKLTRGFAALRPAEPQCMSGSNKVVRDCTINFLHSDTKSCYNTTDALLYA